LPSAIFNQKVGNLVPKTSARPNNGKAIDSPTAQGKKREDSNCRLKGADPYSDTATFFAEKGLTKERGNEKGGILLSHDKAVGSRKVVKRIRGKDNLRTNVERIGKKKSAPSRHRLKKRR